MPSGEGFDRMDVKTSIHRDPKFKKLARLHPDLLASGFMAFVATLGESWSNAERLDARDAWPELLPYSDDVLDALQEVSLLDDDYKVASGTWEEWFGQVTRRRAANRRRWADAKRNTRGGHEEPAETPSNGNAESRVPSVLPSFRPSFRPSVRSSIEDPPTPRKRGDRSNERSRGGAPRTVGDIMEETRRHQERER